MFHLHFSFVIHDTNSLRQLTPKEPAAKPSGCFTCYALIECVHIYVHVQVIIMESISYTAARSNLAKTMEQVCDDHAPIAITRKGEGAVVMISMEDYQALEETAYLLRSPKNTRRLIESIADLEAGKGIEQDLLE
jgi:antitoxin YefM